MDYYSKYMHYKYAYLKLKESEIITSYNIDYIKNESKLKDKIPFLLDIKGQQKYLNLSISNGHKQLLYFIAKIIYDTYFGGKFYKECHFEQKNAFNKEMKNIMNGTYKGKRSVRSYLGLVALPIYKVLLEEFGKFNVKKIKNVGYFTKIDQVRKYFNSLNKEHYGVLFKISKIGALTCSITGNKNYTTKYTKTEFQQEINELNKMTTLNNQGNLYLIKVGIQVYKLVIDHIKK